MSQPLDDILDLFALKDEGGGTYLGPQPDDHFERVRVYGGQVAGQAVAAAAKTVSGRRVHSLHVSFLRPGNPKTPLQYDVVTLREGRTFSTRRVSASQGGVAIMEALISFVVPMDSYDAARPMPDVLEPDALPPLDQQLAKYLQGHDDSYLALIGMPAIETRYIDLPPRIAVDGAIPEHAQCRVWLRTRQPAPAQLLSDPVLATCLLVYISDWTILDPMQIAIGRTWQRLEKMASLDHALWIHRPVDFSDWLLFDQHCPSVAGGIGLGTGAIFNRDGSLVCTVTQEGFVGRRL